jgi:broad specificity phosphatase PhoE
MRKLILIKHAKPLVDPTKTSEQWKLSDEGRAQCDSLAPLIAAHQPAVIVSSEEPKAMETARILSEKLGISTESAVDLHEHDRSNVPHMRSGEFISNVELLFRRPDQMVLGRESAFDALDRFENAIRSSIEKHSEGNIAIVSHGTVIALFVEEHSDRNGFQVWREMGLPSFVVLELPGMELMEVHGRI